MKDKFVIDAILICKSWNIDFILSPIVDTSDKRRFTCTIKIYRIPPTTIKITRVLIREVISLFIFLFSSILENGVNKAAKNTSHHSRIIVFNVMTMIQVGSSNS
jgi:hypothetical protein